MKPIEKIRVLIADDDNQLSRRLADYIKERGFEARICNNGKEARAQILEWKPRFILADLMLPEGNALALIDFIKGEPSLRQHFPHVMVMSGHNLESNVRKAIQHGAKDYIVKPFQHEDIIRRLIFHSRAYRQLSLVPKTEQGRGEEAASALHQTDLILRQAVGGGSLEDILFNLTRMANIKVDGVRCSIIECVDQKIGFVVTSNDDRSASGIQLDLYNYPEVLHVLNTQNVIAIENLEETAELRFVREKTRNIAFNSMIVCPVSRHGRPFGVLSLRMPPEKTTISDNEIRFIEIVSHVVSLVFSNEMHRESKEFWRKPKDSTPLPFPSGQVKNR